MIVKKYGEYLKKLRESKKYTQEKMAEYLNVSRTSYINLEQDKKELSLLEASEIANIFGITIGDIYEESSPDIEKYKEIILTFLKLNSDKLSLKKDGKIPKTKLAKLVYLADFAWYYENLISMSGMQYKKFEYGPVPDIYFRVIDEMFNDGEISIENKGGAILISASPANFKNKSLSNQELTLIKNINTKWEDKNTQEIVKFTHSQLPWKLGRDGEVVHYELITQEDPDHVY